MTEPTKTQQPQRTLFQSRPSEPCVTPLANWRSVTQGVCDGNNECFELLYNDFFDYVLFQVRHATGRDESTCLDITQDCWVKIIRSLKPIDHRPQLAVWIRAVTRSVTYDWLRKESRTANRLRKFQESVGTSTFDQSDDESALDLSNDQHNANAADDMARLHWLEQELNELPAETKSMIAFRYRFGWTLQKIADRFGLKTGAVDGRIRRTVCRLRQKAEQAELEFTSVELNSD